jgi:hypothetical protein
LIKNVVEGILPFWLKNHTNLINKAVEKWEKVFENVIIQ